MIEMKITVNGLLWNAKEKLKDNDVIVIEGSVKEFGYLFGLFMTKKKG